MIASVLVALTAEIESFALMQFSGSEVLARLLSVLLLIAINAFFVTAEFSIVSVRRSRINQLADAGDVQAQTVQALQRGIDRLLSTTQLGITLSSLALGWIGERALVVLMAAWLVQLPFAELRQPSVAHSLAVPLTFLLLVYLQIVLGELCPKAVALLYAEQIARFLGGPSLAIARFFNPFIWILNQSTRLLLRAIGIQYTDQGWYNQVTPEELQRIITTSTESTGLEAEERELLRNVIEFGDVSAGEVMIPRPSVIAIAHTASFKELLEEVASSGHSRYPVIGESLDDVRGIIHFRELADPLAQGTLTLTSSVQAWIRPARFVPEYMLLSELLPLMQRSHQPMMMVVDEFGGTAGVVTIADLIAEILGDTIDSVSEEEQSIQILDDQTFIVQAQMDLEAVNQLLSLELPLTDDYQTLGGFLLFEWQKIPQPGEILEYEGFEFTVISTDGPRLHQIQVHRRDSTQLLADSDSADDRAADAADPAQLPPESPMRIDVNEP